MEALRKLPEEGNKATRTSAFRLLSAETKPEFVVSLAIVAKYSALLEPVANLH